ncbi:MAG: hypothetical protein DMG76_19320, partial [Acidobacteria bacterium]
KHLAERDEHLKRLIEETVPFQLKIEAAQSPYETLLEAVTHQSISGKAAATIFARVKALSSNGGIPTPREMLKLRKPALRKAGLSGAKILAMKDLAQKTINGVVPTLEQAQRLSDEELVKRLVSVRGIGAWTVEMLLIFRLGRADVLPIQDLGVKKGWSITYGKKHMPKPKELLAFGEPTQPCAKSAPPVSANLASTRSVVEPRPSVLAANTCSTNAMRTHSLLFRYHIFTNFY